MRVPYVPTPREIIIEMLTLGELRNNEVLVDAGAGECDVVILGVTRFGAVGIGVELNPALVRRCIEKFRELRLEGRAFVVMDDIMRFDYSTTDLLTLYLGTRINEELRPKLERELPSGARVVSHDFEVPGWEPTRVLEITGPLRTHRIYLYRL